MFKLVVLSALLAVSAAKPHVVAQTVGVAAVPSAVSYQARTDVVSKPVVATYAAPAVATYAAAPAVATYAAAPAVATYAAAPAVATYAAAAPAVATYAAAPAVATYAAAPAVAAVPITGTAYTKNVHYGERDVVTGYTSQVYKPDLGALATPIETVSQTKVVAPARAVATYTEQITKVEPEVSYEKVQVDVPVPSPVVSEVEVRTPIAHAAPVVAAAPVAKFAYAAAAPVAKYAYAAAPVAYAAPVANVAAYSYAAPVAKVAAYSYGAPAAAVSYSAPVAQAW